MPCAGMQSFLAHTALLAATLTFSVWNVLAGAFEGVKSAILLCAMRDATALLMLLVAGTVHRKTFWWWFSAMKGLRDWCFVAAVGLSGPCIAPLANVLCVLWAGSDTAGIFNGLSPACASLLALIFRLERLTPGLAIGVLLGSAGALVATSSAPSASSQPGAGTSGEPSESPTRILVILGAVAGIVLAFAQGVFLVAMRPLLGESNSRPPLSATAVITAAYVFAAGASLFACFVASLSVDGGPRSLVDNWTVENTWLALFAGIVCGALNYALITWSSKILPVTTVALYGAGQPSCTAVLAFFMKGETITLWGLCSAGLVTASICILAFSDSAALPTSSCGGTRGGQASNIDAAPLSPHASV